MGSNGAVLCDSDKFSDCCIAELLFRATFSIDWIEWLNGQLVDKWMGDRAYYKTQYVSANLDNPDQRIQQDVQSYVRTSLSLSTGVIDAVTSMISYTIFICGD